MANLEDTQKPLLNAVEPSRKIRHVEENLTKLGYMDEIEWGWLAHERQSRQERFFKIWNGSMAVIGAVQASIVCFSLAFDPFSIPLLAVSYIFDTFHMIDVCVQVYRAWRVDWNTLEFRPSKSHLMAYFKGWFVADILALLPLDTILWAYKANSLRAPLLARLRCNRLLCAYKIFRYFTQLESRVGANIFLIRGFYYTMLTWLLLHFTACVWYLLPCSYWSKKRMGINYCLAPSWIFCGYDITGAQVMDLDYGTRAFANRNMYGGFFDHALGNTSFVRLNATVAQSYVYSLYWTITTASTVGFGDVHAITIEEQIFAIFCQLEGTIVLFGYIQGGLTSMLTNFDVAQFRYKMRVDAIVHYLRDQNQPSELVREVIHFYRYLWESSRGILSAGLFDRLPFALRSEISMELNGRIFDKSPLLQNINASFLRMLSLNLNPMLALPDQVIMEKGELSDIMLYVQKGELEVLSDDEMEIPVLLLKPGKLFGEINLITRMPRKYSVRAIGHCDLVSLKTSDLMKCLQAYPDVADELRTRAEERAGVAQEETQEGILAAADTHESSKRNTEGKALAAKLAASTGKLGKNIRPLMSALKIARPQETLHVSDSLDLFRIRDPMAELVQFHTSDFVGRMKCRFERLRTNFYEFSLDPDGLFWYFWSRLIALTTAAAFLLNTYVAFFASYNVLMADSSGEIVLTFAYLMDVLLIADFALQFFVQIVTPNGKVKEHDRMTKAYFSSMYFWTDLLSIIPIETIVPMMGKKFDYLKQMHFLGWLRLNRCLKVVSLPKFFDTISDELTSSTPLVRAIKFSIYIAISAQAAAVFLIVTTCAPDECLDPSMLPEHGSFPWSADIIPNITTDDPPSYRYTSAMYYALAILTTAGYGDIYPHNWNEQLTANFVMFLGMLVYGYCIAILTATLANLDGPRVEFQGRLLALKKFMEYNKMAENVKNRAVDSVALLWTMTRGEDVPGEKSMTADLPSYLAAEIQVEDLLHLVAGVPLFKNLEEHILKSFASAVRRYLFPPGEYIIQHGDLIDELFIIRRGICQVFHPEHASMVIGELAPGMYFGEIGFLFNHYEIVSVKTVTHCEVLTIPRTAFNKVATEVPWFNHQMKVIGEDKKYYKNMCNAAMIARGLAKKKREDSPPRMSKAEKRRLMFNDEFSSLSVHPVVSLLYRCLLSYTFKIDGDFLFYWEQVRLLISIAVFVLTLIQVTYAIISIPCILVMYVLDLYAFVDIYIKLHVQYYNEMNVLVIHPYMTARRYLHSNFWIDLIACFPYEVFMTLSKGGTWLRPDLIYCALYLRLNRILQIYRLPLAFTFYESDIKKDRGHLMFIKFGLYFFLLIIFVLAMPYIVACPPTPCGTSALECHYGKPGTPLSPAEWAKAYMNMRTCTDTVYLARSVNISSSTSTISQQFLYGFYWAVTTICDVGYGDIHATSKNADEQMLFGTMMIVGYIFFGYVLASIAAAQANSDARRSRFYDRLTAIKEYMHHERLPKVLRNRVLHYYAYLWLRTQGVDPKSLIAGLPPSLTAELALQLYRKVIEQVSLFKGTPPGFKKMLAAIVKPLYIMEGEYVIKVEDTGSELYFLFRGSVEVQFCNGVRSPKILRAGSMLGEVAFFTNEISKISCRALENSDLYYVARADFESILVHFPEIQETLLKDMKSNLEKDDEYRTNTQVNARTVAHAKPRSRFRESLAAIRSKKLTLKQRVRLALKANFRSEDAFVRNFSKFFVNAMRVFSIAIILYQAAFMDFRPGFYAIGYVLEFIFFLNISVQLRTGFLDEFGNEIMDPARIRKRYFKSPDLFLSDLAASFPYELVCFATSNPIKRQLWWAYGRCVRLLPRLYQMLQFFYKWVAELDINVLVVRMTFSFTQLFLWIHFFTCVVFFIAYLEESYGLPSWRLSTPLQHITTPGDAYITSMYFTVTTATTTGYGDILPKTPIEIIFVCLVQIIGKMLFGIIVGDVASTLANLEISRQNFESKFQAIKTYLHDRQANDKIVDRTQQYFNYLWNVDKGIEDINTVLQDAPFCLRTEITYAVHHKDMRELPLFRESSDAFIRMISSMLQQVQFMPGDYIIQQGDLVEEMYFLHHGEALEVENGVEISVLKRGTNINWQALLIDWPASRTVRATDNCEVYVLTRKHLNEAVEKYQDEMGHVCTTNRIRLRDLLEEERMDFD